VRMRADVDALAGQELCRAHLVEEDEGADHLPLRRRKRPAHLEPAEVAGAGDDRWLDRIAAAASAQPGARAAGCEGGATDALPARQTESRIPAPCVPRSR
jgi:hypothetical protein